MTALQAVSMVLFLVGRLNIKAMKKTKVISGLVLRETPLKEYNKIITMLTAEQGLVSVYCYGAMSLKNSNFAPTQLFCYSELEVTEGKMGYVLKNSSIIRRFCKGNNTLLKLAFESYIAEVLLYVCCENTNEEDMFRLAMNIIYANDEKLRDIRQLKAVFDLRCALYQGMAPELDGCVDCGEAVFWLDYSEGVGYCKKHSQDYVDEHGGRGAVISGYCLETMRYVLNCSPKKILSFELNQDFAEEFAFVCEKYLEYQLEYRFLSLDFYHTAEKSE